MRSAGQICEIWRYPVSSVGGERVSVAEFSQAGLHGDRQYGLIDAKSGQPAVPEKNAKWRKALHLTAAMTDMEAPVVCFPDGARLSVNDSSLNNFLTDFFGFEVAIAAYEHTERHFDLPLTEFRHRHLPLHLLTTASVNHLATLHQSGTIDTRRFRPNLLIDVNGAVGFVENGWVGRRLRIGDIDLMVDEDTKRCGVTFISQPGIDEDPEILRSILRNNKRNLGIYCSITQRGAIALGDELFIET